ERLNGADFGMSGEIEVPLFQVVKARTVNAANSKPCQIDVYGLEQGQDAVWLCECKYTKTAMNMSQVEKLEQAAEVFVQEELEAGRPRPSVQLWLVSTGGFTKETLEYVKDREDVYFSGYDGINNIFQAYGGNYTIPVFHDA
ncbi:MAG: hypothetical protein GY794_10730, partial [bacterium]|nr:hypothetical protein [bacterium]